MSPAKGERKLLLSFANVLQTCNSDPCCNEDLCGVNIECVTIMRYLLKVVLLIEYSV